jgi:hypothetical protein
MFDNTPPEPPVIGTEPILTLCTDPWEHLMRSGHTNVRVNTLVMAMKPALATIAKSKLPNYSLTKGNPDVIYMWETTEHAVEKRLTSMSCEQVRKFVTEEELRRFTGLLNSYLYKRMRGSAAVELAADLDTLQQMGPFYRSLNHFERSPYIAIAVGTARSEIVAFDESQSQQLKQEQPQRQAEFYSQLEQLAQLLAREPIRTTSGLYGEKRDRPRPFADVTNETANTLSMMQPYHALCKLIDPQGQRVQHLIKTSPPSPIAADAYERAASMRQASREQYGRPQAEVEEEIWAREAAWMEILSDSVYRPESSKPAKKPRRERRQPASNGSSILNTSSHNSNGAVHPVPATDSVEPVLSEPKPEPSPKRGDNEQVWQ